MTHHHWLLGGQAQLALEGALGSLCKRTRHHRTLRQLHLISIYVRQVTISVHWHGLLSLAAEAVADDISGFFPDHPSRSCNFLPTTRRIEYILSRKGDP